MRTVINNGGHWTVMVGDVDISDAVRSIQIEHSNDVVDVTHFDGSSRHVVRGFQETVVTLELVCTPDVSGNHVQLFTDAIPTRVTRRIVPDRDMRVTT